MKSKSKKIIISVFLIAVAGFAVYGNSLSGKFIWDDSVLIGNNPFIKSWSGLPRIFTENIAAGTGLKWNSYRPLQMLTYMVNYSLGGLDVRGYHLTNVLLHVLAALGIFWLCNLLFHDSLLALLTGIFFAIHPIHTSAVTYISGRADSLTAVFLLLSFVFYLKSLRAGNRALYSLSLLSFVLALLSRENSLVLPALLLLYHFTFRVKIRLPRILPFAGITLLYFIFRLTLLRPLLPHLQARTILWQRLPGFFAALLNYLRLQVLPFNLHMEYGSLLFRFGDPRTMGGMFAFFVLMILIFVSRKKAGNDLLFFALAWFILALLPSSNLYPLNSYMAEHWLYLPSLGFFLLLANGLIFLWRRQRKTFLAAVVTAGMLFFYSALTIRQNAFWREPIIFYERNLRCVPDSVRTLTSIAAFYNDTGRAKAAIPLLEKAVSLEPSYADAYNSLGVAYQSLGDLGKAEEWFEKTLTVKPDYAEAYYNLGSLVNLTGRHKEAIDLLEKALKLRPGYIKAHNNLAVACFYDKQYGKAVEHYRKAIGSGYPVNPRFAELLKPYM